MRMRGLCLTITLIATASISLGATPKLDLNDVSWLWPVPRTLKDLCKVISLDKLTSTSGEAVWSDGQFADLLNVVDSGGTKVKDAEIAFASDIRTKAVWRIAGMRVDPSAPGCDADVRNAFGSRTQIRLIVQPITVVDGTPKVHDVAVHLVFEWTTGNDDQGRKFPDNAQFKQLVADLDEVKAVTRAAGATTSGKPLGVHPGLDLDAEEVRNAAKDFLAKHLSADKLSSMALMGIDGGVEPWIFFATTKSGNGHFGPIPAPVPAAAPQMIDFRSSGQVSPTPLVHNRAPITPSLSIPLEDRRGVSTAVLFERFDENAFAVIGNERGIDIIDSEVRNRDIPDVVANPSVSHFFNTDCVSCHTETRRRLNFAFPVSDLAFRRDGETIPIEPDSLPKHDWNVRNFGWFPPHEFIGGGRTVATVTQRTANETAEVVEFIERNFRRTD